MLQTLIRIPSPPLSSELSSEDIFDSALHLIFPDDASTLHGDPGSLVIYKSKLFGEITLGLSRPDSEEDRRLFAQYLWNAGVLMAEFVSLGGNFSGRGRLSGSEGMRGYEDWNVVGEKVLELGAGESLRSAVKEGEEGTGLAGIVSVLAGAQEVVISDYPTPGILAAIKTNCAKNIPPSHSSKRNNVRVIGHEWGVVDDEFSRVNARRFTRILAADCLWMVGKHQNLVTSMLHFLSDDDDDDDGNEKKAQVWVVAGFHTGRTTLVSFFEVAHDAGLEVKHIWERDVQGNEREWVKEPHKSRPEDIATLRKWLVIAILGRK